MDKSLFLADLDTFIRFKTCVEQNQEEFDKAREWIKAFFDPARTEFVELNYNGFTNLIVRAKGSKKPKVLGDGHIEVVPAVSKLFSLRRINGLLYGRGVADMKTQCLTMMWVLRELIAEDNHNDFWLLFTEDEEIGSPNGVRRMVDYLADNDQLPDVVFIPDGGPDFAYVEKEKGIIRFNALVSGKAAHASRPFLGLNAIERTFGFYKVLREQFPNPKDELDWVPSLALTRINAGDAFNQIPDVCIAGFDLRFTEDYSAVAIVERIQALAAPFATEILVQEVAKATYYPKEGPMAQTYLEILRRVSGKEPTIFHSNGASNGHFYVAKRPSIQVLMSNPTVVGSHAEEECLVEDSLEPYYKLVRETALL